MYEHERRRLEAELARIRRSLFRAVEIAEVAQDFGLEEDLRSLNVEAERIQSVIMRLSRRT